MADVRPLQGLRYQPETAGDLSNVIAPPYDVISEDAQRSLYARSPYNVVRLEYGLDEPAAVGDRYERAAETLAGWRRSGVLRTDKRPSFYLYEQEFDYEGRHYRRRAIIGRVRIEPWDTGVIRPHEFTLSGPKEDRLHLLRACRCDISPVFGLYRPDGGAATAICEGAIGSSAPAVEAVGVTGQLHRLWVVDEPDAVEDLQRRFVDQTLYVADGHHRYETAWAYRDERRSASAVWSGDEPENFVMMALTAADDPGLLILPIHRLVHPVRQPGDLRAAVRYAFDVAGEAEGNAGALIEQLAKRQNGADIGSAFVALGAERNQALVLTLSNRDAVERQMPEGRAAAWRRLDVNVLQYGIFEPLLGIDIETVRSGGRVEFTERAEEALKAVASGNAPLAFLLNPTRAEEIFVVADAGERMPQKSTYFYPKLGTGLVLYGLDS